MLKDSPKDHALSILRYTHPVQTATAGVKTMQTAQMEQLHAQLRVLGMRHTWEIIANIRNGSKYMKQIAHETKIPYTTVQKRVSDMSNAGIVKVFSDVDSQTGKAIKKVRVSRFKINLDPHMISQVVQDEMGYINR
jgi:predicted transcriptional regulator